MKATRNGLIHDSFLGADVSVMINSADTEGMKGGKLSATGSQRGKRWGGIGNVGNDEVLDVRGEAVMVLVNKVKAPKVDSRWK
jgi:hypothetical protein